MTDLARFLKQHDLEKYLTAFVENEVDLDTLPDLNDDDLKELGLPLGPRRKLQKAIELLQPAESQEIESSTEPLGEHRQVTVLFADLCRFSEISSQLGAENTHSLLNQYFEKVDEIVEQYGGTIDKHIGDCVMAVFGAPVAHNNDPERAIRAASDIHQVMKEMGKVFNQDLASHIGIASGQVVASGTGSDRHRTYTITGESVNLASRLSDLASAGETLVSEEVKQSALRIASFLTKGELTIKGFDEAINVWELSELRMAPAEQGRHRLIGRTRECTQFSNFVAEVLQSGLGQILIIRGEPGIGKTRLIEEFTSLSNERGLTCCKAHVLDFGVGKGQDPLRILTAGVAGLELSAGKAERHAFLERSLSDGTLQESQAVFLIDLLNLPLVGELQSTYQAMDNTARNDGKREVFCQLVKARTDLQPLLLLVEDIHWCDHLTLDFMSALAGVIAENPILLVLTSRPEGPVMDQGWLSSFAPCPLTTTELMPLRKDEAIALAVEISKKKLDEIDELVTRADGNPLFIEQLAQGGIEIAGDQLPDTLQGLVLARTDRLELPDALALKAASVIGNRFSLSLLRHLTGEPDYDCASLLEHRLVRVDDAEFLFGHALIRDGVYASLLRADRQQLHLAAAEWFRDNDSFLHAQHLDRAESPQAASAYQNAAEIFQQQHQLERAIDAARLGSEITTDAAEKRSLQQLQGRLLHDVGRLEAARDAYQSALDNSAGSVDSCRARIWLAAVLMVTDQINEAWQQLDQAQTIAESKDLYLERAEIHELRGNLCFPLGRVEQCLKEHKLGLEFARKAGSPHAQAQSLGGLSDAHYAAGQMKSANELLVECIDFANKHGLERIKVANLSSLAATRKYLLDLETAIVECREAERIAKAIGAKRSLINALHTEIESLIERMELDLADGKIKEAIALIEELGAPRFMARALHYQGRVLLSRNDPGNAHAIFEKALDISLSTGSGYVGPTIASSLALSCSDPKKRAGYLNTGLELLDKGAVAHNRAEYFRDAMAIALIEKRWEDVPALSASMREFSTEPLPWIEFWTSYGETLARQGSADTDTAIANEIDRLCTIATKVGLLTALPALERARASIRT